ncbi:hypothetical protein L9F63_025487, partial [Diploptera punctata]
FTNIPLHEFNMKENSKEDDSENRYRPSAPVPTGTIPRRSSKHKSSEFEGLYEFELPTPTAPPLEQMEEVAGYELTTFDDATIPPPPESNTSVEEDSINRTNDTAEHHVTEKIARDALIKFAKKRCHRGVKPARNMAMTSFKETSAYHYELQTYTERRETSWKFMPYRGTEVDDSDNGPAPLPWDIEVCPSGHFVNEEKVITVPHTQSVKQCHSCKGVGNIPCNDCNGKGWAHCKPCRLALKHHCKSSRCLSCAFSHHGTGRQDCTKCFSRGKVMCATCEGYCLLLYYIALTINWRVITADHVVDELQLPELVVRDVSGRVRYEEEGPRVIPIRDVPNEGIRMASVQYIREHLLHNRNQQILFQ